MRKKRLSSILSKYDPWRLIGTSLVGGIVVMAGMLVFESVSMLWQKNVVQDVSSIVNTIDSNSLSALLGPGTTSFREFEKDMRFGLFKPATPSQDKPMADKTIETIVSQLQLKCVTELNGERVAYIKIQGVGLRKCRVGDTVNDLLAVINIYENKVEIKIVGHTTMLKL